MVSMYSQESEMKWFTMKELLHMFKHHPCYQGNDVHLYAQELGDGVRFWVTIIASCILLGSVALPFGATLKHVIIPIVMAFGCLTIMTTGYITGGFFVRGFSPSVVFALAIKHVRK